MKCEDGTEYHFLHSSCHATCHEPNAAEQCHFPDAEGCYCPDGLFLRDDECVPLAECGCMLEDDSYVDISLVDLSSNCSCMPDDAR